MELVTSHNSYAGQQLSIGIPMRPGARSKLYGLDSLSLAYWLLPWDQSADMPRIFRKDAYQNPGHFVLNDLGIRRA